MKRSTWVLLGLVVALVVAILVWERNQPSTDESAEQHNKVFDLSPDKVTELARSGEGPLQLKRGPEDQWSLLAPLKDAADRYAVEGFVERLNQARALRFPEAGTPLASMGLDKPRATWDVRGGDRPILVEVGAKAPLGEGLYLRVAGRPALVPADLESLLLRPADDFRLKNLTAAATQDVQSLSLEGEGGRKLAFHRTAKDGGWQVTAPFDDWGAEDKITQVLDDVSLCLVDSFLDAGANASLDRKGAGLDPPRDKIRIEMTKGPAVDIALGGPVPGGDPKKDLIYATVSGRPSVMVISRNGLKSLFERPDGLRSLGLFRRDVSEAKEVSVGGPHGLSMTRGKDGAWKVEGKASSGSAAPDAGAVIAALEGLKGERAIPWTGPSTPGFGAVAATITLKGEGFEEMVEIGQEQEGRRLAHAKGRPVAIVLKEEPWKSLEACLRTATSPKGSSGPTEKKTLP